MLKSLGNCSLRLSKVHRGLQLFLYSVLFFVILMNNVVMSFVAASLFSVPDMLESAEAACFPKQQATKLGGKKRLIGCGACLMILLIAYLANCIADCSSNYYPLIISLSHPIELLMSPSLDPVQIM